MDVFSYLEQLGNSRIAEEGRAHGGDHVSPRVAQSERESQTGMMGLIVSQTSAPDSFGAEDLWALLSQSHNLRRHH